MKRTTQPKITTTAAILTLLVVVTAVAAQDRATTTATPAQANRSQAIDLTRYSGIARASKELTITAPTDGLLAGISFVEGDTVEPGQEIAAMDDRVQQATVEVARLQASNRAPLIAAQESANFYTIELEEALSLFENNAASQREVRLAEVQLAQAKAEVQNAEARLKESAATFNLEKKRLDQLHIRSHFAGRVMEVIAEPGTSLRIGDPLLRIAKLDPLEVKLPLPAELYRNLTEGKMYRLNAGVPVNRKLNAKLLRLRPEIDAASDTFIATFEIPNQNRDLPAGFRVHMADQPALTE